MAHDEDPVDELRSVGMTSAAALSRVAETMIRAAQDHKMRSAQQAAQEAEEGQRRYDAQAQVAERFYREAIDKDLMVSSPRAEQDALRQGAQEWAELDPGRFGPYSERLNAQFETGVGRSEPGYDPTKSENDPYQSGVEPDRLGDHSGELEAGLAAASEGSPYPAVFRTNDADLPVMVTGPSVIGTDGDRYVPTSSGAHVPDAGLIGADRASLGYAPSWSHPDGSVDRAAFAEAASSEGALRPEAGRADRFAEEQASKAAPEEEPERTEAYRQASAAAVARGDEASNEADRHGQVADEIDAEGPAYDSAERRAETVKEMKQAGVPEPQREAKLTADHLNAEHPKTAARGSQGRQKTAAKGRSVEQARKRTKTLGRGR